MSVMSPSYKRHLENMQNEFDAEKFRESRILDLYNERTFYPAFVRDMLKAEKEVVIYCPFISKYRSEFFKNTLEKLRHRNVAVFIFTRPLEEHELLTRNEIKAALADYEELGACIVQLPGFIHAKAAIIDREIVWDGSLNILSQRLSKESMRRTQDKDIAKQMVSHLGLNRKIAEGYKYQYERLYRSLVEKSKFKVVLKIKAGALVQSIVKIFRGILFAIPKAFILLLKCIKIFLTLLT
jgi:phosphatidylserine/phosphatidylglycerophosphate/cardiolipin synthase-like enzyme